MIELTNKKANISLSKDNDNIEYNKELLKGEDGGYYVPFVNNYGDLNWTPTKADMPRVDTKNIKGARGAKGEDGKDGEDGFSPTVSIGVIENGHQVNINDANGLKSFNVYNGKDGKDGTATITVKSKYYANDWADGCIYPDAYAGNGEIVYFIVEPLPDNAYILDISARYNGEDYRLNTLPYRNLVHPNSIVDIPKKQVEEPSWGMYVIGRIIDISNSGDYYNDVINSSETVQGFTVYYYECVEGDNNENT